MTSFHHSGVDRGQPSKDNINGCLARLGVSELHKEVASPCKGTGDKVDCAVAVCSRLRAEISYIVFQLFGKSNFCSNI